MDPGCSVLFFFCFRFASTFVLDTSPTCEMDLFKFLREKDYRNRPNYRTCSYKCTVKQFSSLKITASVLFSTSL